MESFIQEASDGTLFKKHAFSKEGRYDPREVLVKLVLDGYGEPDRIVWGKRNHHVMWQSVKYVVWGHHSPAFKNINRNMKLEKLTCFSIFCERTILDFQHDEIGKVEQWVNGFREFKGQTRDDVNRFIERLRKYKPTILPKRVRQIKEIITRPRANMSVDLAEEGIVGRPRANTSVDFGEEIVGRPRTPHNLDVERDLGPGLILDDREELKMLRQKFARLSFVPTNYEKQRFAQLTESQRDTKIDVKNDDSTSMLCCCTDVISLFIAYCIHSVAIIALFAATFPWTAILLCANIHSSPCRFGHLIIGFSFILNTCLLFGPFHFWESTHSLDQHLIAELSVSMTGFAWFLCHTKCCCGGKYTNVPQSWLLEVCCVTPPKSTLAFEEDERYTGKFYFLQLASTFAFLISISVGLTFALCLELFRISDRHPLTQLILYGSCTIFVWFLILRVFCTSLVSTFGNAFSTPTAEQPLLSDGIYSSVASTVMQHTESEPP